MAGKAAKEKSFHALEMSATYFDEASPGGAILRGIILR